MIVQCKDCQATFDDARQSTLCPHDKLMPDEDMDRKIAAIALLDRAYGKHVKFVDGFQFHPYFKQSPDGRYRIMSMNWCGMISLDGVDGDFPPGLFEVTE